MLPTYLPVGGSDKHSRTPSPSASCHGEGGEEEHDDEEEMKRAGDVVGVGNCTEVVRDSVGMQWLLGR